MGAVATAASIRSIVVHIQSILLLILVVQRQLHLGRRLSNAGVTKAIEDINIGHVVVFGRSLEHWVSQAREDLVDFVQKQRQEAVIAIASQGSDAEDLVKVLARTNGKWITGSRLKRQELGHGVGSLNQFLNEA